jgi:signal transduction histidine kinase
MTPARGWRTVRWVDLRRALPPAGDVAVAAAFAAIGVSLAAGVLDGPNVVPGIAVTLLHSGALAWRRRTPEIALAAMAATGAIAVLAGLPAVILGPALLAGVHGLGIERERSRSLPVLLATVVAMAVVVPASGMDRDTVLSNSVALAVAWWVGDRQRQAHERAERAERGRDEHALAAVAAERLRIARELHDVVAHALSVIAVQAGTGRVVLDTDAETARSALASIETESRAALDEMRRLVAVMRADQDTGSASLAPSPGLDDLDALVAATARSGLDVQVVVEGDRAALPAGAGLAAYRIVQEALTNVRRHAVATRAEVRVTWSTDAVDIEVIDDGRGSDRHNGADGHGLVGMRERAALYGGSFEAADRPGGGFRVAASIPAGRPR